jgi:hypothetical protein
VICDRSELGSWIAKEGESFSCDQSELGKLDCRGGRWISRKEEVISEEEEAITTTSCTGEGRRS